MEEIAQILGVVSVLLIFSLQFFIAIYPPAFVRLGRTTLFWTSVFVFFLFILRLFSLFNLGTVEQLRIVSGFTSPIPLIAVIISLFLGKKVKEGGEKLIEKQL